MIKDLRARPGLAEAPRRAGRHHRGAGGRDPGAQSPRRGAARAVGDELAQQFAGAFSRRRGGPREAAREGGRARASSQEGSAPQEPLEEIAAAAGDGHFVRGASPACVRLWPPVSLARPSDGAGADPEARPPGASSARARNPIVLRALPVLRRGDQRAASSGRRHYESRPRACAR